MRRAGAVALSLWLALGAGCGDDPVAPFLQAVLPDRGAPEAQVDLLGERLQGSTVQVSLGGKTAVLLFGDVRRLRVRVPSLPAGQQLLTVTVDGRVSNPLGFTVEGPP